MLLFVFCCLHLILLTSLSVLHPFSTLGYNCCLDCIHPLSCLGWDNIKNNLNSVLIAFRDHLAIRYRTCFNWKITYGGYLNSILLISFFALFLFLQLYSVDISMQ